MSTIRTVIRRGAYAAAVALAALLAVAPAALASGGGGSGGGGGSAQAVIGMFVDTNQPGASGSGSGLVDLDAPAPSSGSVVGLSSSNPAALSVPATLTVPAGSSSASFAYTTGAVSSPTPVTITATLGASSISVGATVTPLALQSLLVSPSAVLGGDVVTLRPQLTQPAPAGGALVSLSSDSALAPVPDTVLVPAGSFSAPVTIATGAVTAPTTATIAASWNGVTVSSRLTMTVPQPPVSLTLSPSSTFGANGSTGTVRFASATVPRGQTISLSSSDPSLASVVPSVSVPGNSLTGSFAIVTKTVAAPVDVTISASSGGGTVSATLTLTPPPPPTPALASLGVSSSSVAPGASATGTVSLNVPAPAGGALVSLFSSNSAVATMPASVTIPEGQTSASFAVATKQAGAVSLGATWSGSQQATLFNVLDAKGTALPPAPQSFDLEPSSLSPVAVGQQHLNIFVTWDGALQALTPSISSGSLPAGMTLRPFNAVAWVITGVPTTQQTKAFVLKFTGANGAAWGVPIVWTVGPPAPLSIAGAPIPDGTVGQPYDGGFFFGGGVAPYRWSISAGALPPGLKLDSTTSEISGTPTTRGTFDFTARLTDSTGVFLDVPEEIVVS